MDYIKQLIVAPYTEHDDGRVRPAPDTNLAEWERGLVAPDGYHWVPIEIPALPVIDQRTHRIQSTWTHEANRKVLVHEVIELDADEQLKRKDRKSWPDVGAFWNEFTADEQAAIVGSSDSNVKLLNDSLAKWRADIWADDPRIVQGLGLLVTLSILTVARRDAILT